MMETPKFSFTKFAHTLACFPLVILITFIFSSSALIFLPYWLVVQLVVFILRPDLGGIVYGGPNNLYATNTGPIPTANITTYLIIDGHVGVEEIRNRFHERILTELAKDGTLAYGKLKQVLTPFMGYRFFRPVKNFDLASHVRAYDHTGSLAVPADNPHFMEKDFDTILGNLGAKPWEEGRSHWELLIMDKFKTSDDGEVKSLLIFRIDHAYSDGFSAFGILKKLDDDPYKYSERTFTSAPRSSLWLKIVRFMLFLVKIIWDSSSQLANVKVGRGLWSLGRNAKKSRELLSVCTGPLEISKIKKIKNHFRVSFISVLITALARALRRMSAESVRQLPENIFCVFPLPKPNHPGGLTNHHFAGAMTIPMAEAASAARTLKTVDEAFSTSAKSAAQVLLDFWLTLMSFLPAQAMIILSHSISPSLSIGIFSDHSELKICGNKVSGGNCVITPLAKPATNGAAATIIGGVGSQRISLVMSRNIFPDVESFRRLGDYIEEDIETMYDSTWMN